MDVGLQPLYCIGSVFWTAVGSIRACAQCVNFPVVFLVLCVPLLFLSPFLSHFSLPIVLLIAFPPPLTSCILSSSLYSSFLSFYISLPSSPSPSLLQVRWSKERYHHTLASPYLLRLASVNSSSLCAVWDVSQACVLAEFTLGQKQVHDIQWLSTGVSHSSVSCSDGCISVCCMR